MNKIIKDREMIRISVFPLLLEPEIVPALIAW
jgi:hypothetical protein